MKKAILFVLALILLSVVTNAQDKAFDENSRLINVGFGIGGNYYGYSRGLDYTYRRTPIICISYEQPYKKKLGPGFLGIGAYLNYQRTSYLDDDNFYFNQRYYYKHVYQNIVVAGRAAYHWDGLNAKNAEVYGGAMAGLRIQTYQYSSDYPGSDKNYYRAGNRGGVFPAVSVFAGARWYFVPKVAVYGEAAGGLAAPWLTAGVTFKI